jgi:nucleoside diphosphate kinase
MDKVYMTKSRLSSIAKMIAYEYSGTEIRHIYESQLLKFFSTRELKLLEAVNLILESIEQKKLRVEIIKMHENAKDKIEHYYRNEESRWIYLGSQPCYHYDQTCESLQLDYHNYEIPVEIPKDRVKEYRKFFLENIDLYIEKAYLFYYRVEKEFNVKIHNVKEVYNENSGIQDLKLTRKNEIQALNAIYLLVEEMNEYKNQSSHIKKIIQNTGFNTKMSLKYPAYANDVEIIQTWDTYKKSLNDLIIQDLIARKNPEYKFDEGFLEELGLKKCSKCF